MIATINGAVVSGTPEEIQQLITLNNTSVVTASSTTGSAKKEDTARWIKRENDYWGKKEETPIADDYMAYNERQAVEAYKNRLVEKLETTPKLVVKNNWEKLVFFTIIELIKETS